MIDGRDLDIESILVGLVLKEALLDDGFAVFVQRNSAAFIHARSLDEAGLGLEHVVFSVTVAIDPLADRIAGKIRLALLGPIAAVSVDAARHVVVGDEIGRLRRDHEGLQARKARVRRR